MDPLSLCKKWDLLYDKRYKEGRWTQIRTWRVRITTFIEGIKGRIGTLLWRLRHMSQRSFPTLPVLLFPFRTLWFSLFLRRISNWVYIHWSRIGHYLGFLNSTAVFSPVGQVDWKRYSSSSGPGLSGIVVSANRDNPPVPTNARGSKDSNPVPVWASSIAKSGYAFGRSSCAFRSMSGSRRFDGGFCPY